MRMELFYVLVPSLKLNIKIYTIQKVGFYYLYHIQFQSDCLDMHVNVLFLL